MVKDCIKFGFGFFVGYELARSINEVLKEAIPVVIKRIKEGC